MRPRPRLRKTAKWAGVVVCAGLTAAAILSKWWMASVPCDRDRRSRIAVGGGTVAYHAFRDALMHWSKGTVVVAEVIDWPYEWSWRLVADSNSLVVRIPLWIPFLLCGIPTALLWRRDHVLTKRARGRCPKCDYDRSGLTHDAPCP